MTFHPHPHRALQAPLPVCASCFILHSSPRGVASALELKIGVCAHLTEEEDRATGRATDYEPRSSAGPAAGVSGQTLASGEGSLTNCSYTLTPKCQWDKSRLSRGTSFRPHSSPLSAESWGWEPGLHPCWKLAGHGWTQGYLS